MLFRVRGGDFVDKPSFEESLRALAARRPRGEDHPTLQELVAYRAGELPPEGEDRIQEHLTQCHDCAQLLLDLAEFEQFPPPPEEMGPVDARTEASWQRLRTRLREGEEEREEEEAPAVLFPRRPRVPPWQRPALPWALAAGLALCSVGLWQWAGRLQSEIGRLEAPQLNVPVEDLSAGETRGARPEVPVLRGGGVLVLYPPTEAAEYEVEAVSTDGELVIRPLRGPAIDEVLTLSIPPTFLPAGRYSARLYGIDNGERKLLKEYAFEISPVAP